MAIAISRSQRVASTICSSRMNQAYFAITTTSRYATSRRSQIRSDGFSSIRDGRYLILRLSRMETDLGKMLYLVEGEEDQKSEQQKSNHRDHPPLGFARFI